MLDRGAQAVKLIQLFHIGRLDASINLRLQIIVLHKKIVPCRGDRESSRDPEIHLPPDLGQTGHLASHKIRHAFVHFPERLDQRTVVGKDWGADIGIDLHLDLFEAEQQGAVFPRGKVVQVLHDLKNTRGDARAPGPDKGHPKGPGPLQGLFHLGHDVEGLVVGVEKELEQVVAALKSQAQLFRALRLRLGAFAKQRSYVFKDSHPNAVLWPQPNHTPETRISNIEQEISNDEVKSLLFLPSAFVIRYSIFCGSLLNFFAACKEVFV